MSGKTVCTFPKTEKVNNDNHGKSKGTKWKQYTAGVTASMSMVAMGAWFSWPTELLPHMLASPDSPVRLTPDQASWMVGCVEVGSLMAPFPATYVADNYGRKACMLVIAPLSFASLLLIVCQKDPLSLCAARLLQGLAISVGFAIVPIYLGEIASAESRGRVTGLFNVAWSLGCLFPFCVQPFLTYYEFTHATFLLTVMFLLAISWQPESPYFYAMRGDERKTVETLNALRDYPTETSIREELNEIKSEVTERKEKKGSWRDLLSTPEDRKALLIIIFTGMVLQFSGQNAIYSYVTEIFSTMPDNLIPPGWMTLFVGIAALTGSVFNVYVSDRFRRRFLLLMSSVGCFLSLFAAAAYFYVRQRTVINVASVSWIAPMGVIGYVLFLTAGINSVFCSYTSELFPTKTRAAASGVSNTNLALSSFMVLKFYENIKTAIGIDFVFFLYSIICALGAIVFYFFMPETKGMTFLEVRNLLRPVRT